MAAGPKHVYEVYIRTTPERLWRAITDPADTRLYYYGSDVRVRLEARLQARVRDHGEVNLDCKILEVEPEKKLVHSFSAIYDPELAAEPPTRVTWEIEQMGEACRLRSPRRIPERDQDLPRGRVRLAAILSGLKTLIETGKPLVFDAPAETPA